MKIKIVHPLWTNLPALAIFIFLIVSIIAYGPYPASAPIHFGFGGTPDSYGAPWGVFALLIALSVLFLGISFCLDELWAKQEKQKTFNWFSLLDEIMIGSMTGINLGYLLFLRNGGTTFDFPWLGVLLMTGGAVILAVTVELIRPYRASESDSANGTAAQPAVILKPLPPDAKLVYWDYQNPVYYVLITVGLPLVLFVAAVIIWFSVPLESFIILPVGLLFVLQYGGLRTLVTRQQVAVRWGLLGFPVLKLKMQDIKTVEILEFSPLRDFGGWGIRMNKGMTAYFLAGHTGVVLTTVTGKKVLIGSYHAEELAGIIKSIQVH